MIFTKIAERRHTLGLRPWSAVTVMNWRNYIVATTDTHAGKPRINGTRIAVELIPDGLAAGWTEARIVEAYPHVDVTQIRAVVAFASSRVGQDRSLSGVEAAA